MTAYLPILGEFTNQPIIRIPNTRESFVHNILKCESGQVFLPGLLGLWWLVPESPRWLIGSGNFEQVIPATVAIVCQYL